MKILAIHGIGHQENFPPPPPWQAGWDEAIKTGVSGASASTPVEIQFPEYDDLLEPVLAELGIREFNSGRRWGSPTSPRVTTRRSTRSPCQRFLS
jgi:hypothetical protein